MAQVAVSYELLIGPIRNRVQAEVGDDVYAEDPTVNRLQAMLAERAGFEAGLFMPSGSMSNQVALAAHAGRGHEVIAPEGAHIYEYEIGALSALSGLVPRLVSAPRWVRRLGCEWLFRLMLEPRRLFQRYVLGNPLFLLRTLIWRDSV